MTKEIIAFDNIEIEKHKFHHHKNLIFIEDLDIGNVLHTDIWYGFFLIGYYDVDYKTKPLGIMLPKTNAYGQTKWMYFLTEDDELLKNVMVLE